MWFGLQGYSVDSFYLSHNLLLTHALSQRQKGQKGVQKHIKTLQCQKNTTQPFPLQERTTSRKIAARALVGNPRKSIWHQNHWPNQGQKQSQWLHAKQQVLRSPNRASPELVSGRKSSHSGWIDEPLKTTLLDKKCKNSFEYINVIGKGGFGKVFKVR